MNRTSSSSLRQYEPRNSSSTRAAASEDSVMANPLLRSHPYNSGSHDASDFHCGVDELNDWLRRYADHAHRSGTANTFVWVKQGRVVGYYAMSAHVVACDDLPQTVSRGAPAIIPAIMLGKLALDESLQHRGYGRLLVLDAMARASYASGEGPAAKLIVVDAIDRGVAGWYSKLGFKLFINSSTSLFMKMSTARRDVDAALAQTIVAPGG